MRRDPGLIPLSHQHQHALALCVLLRRRLPVESASVLAGEVLSAFDEEIANHFAIEEQVLFPACGPLPIIAELLGDHRHIEALVAQLRSAPSPALLEEFCDRLSRHVRREEHELFEHIQRQMHPDVLAVAGDEIRRRIDIGNQ